jgi:hypothetical protein
VGGGTASRTAGAIGTCCKVGGSDLEAALSIAALCTAAHPAPYVLLFNPLCCTACAVLSVLYCLCRYPDGVCCRVGRPDLEASV